VKISGGAITLVVTLVSQGVLAIDFELKKLASIYLQTIKKIIDTISALPPAVLSVLGGDDLKNAFGSIADIWSKSADTKKVNPYLEKLKSDSKEISTIITDSMIDIGKIPKSVENTYSTITWEVRKRINELNELSKKGIDTSALQKMLEDYEKGLGDTGDNLKQILITNEEAMRDYYDTISKYSQEWLDSQLKQYRIEIDAKYSTVLTKQQIDNMYYAKERELQKEAFDYFQNIENEKVMLMKENYEKELAETQKFWEAYQKYIETSREIELQVTTDRNRYVDLRIQKIQEEYEEYQKQGINSVLLDKWRADQIKKIYSEIPDNIKNISDIVQKNMSNISANITNVLGNTIYDFISRTKSMKDAWNNAWESMAEITMRIISQIIAQMLELFFMQKLVGLATGGIGEAIGAGGISKAPGAKEGIVPAPTGKNNLSNININNQQNELMMFIDGLKRNMPGLAPGALDTSAVPIASTGRNNLSNINISNQQNELMMSIDGLKREIASNREQNFNLYLDGLPLRNAIKRVEKNLNVMGN